MRAPSTTAKMRLLTVSKNVSKGVVEVLVLVGAVFACVTNEIRHFQFDFDV
jgi:hypothetical protein